MKRFRGDLLFGIMIDRLFDKGLRDMLTNQKDIPDDGIQDMYLAAVLISYGAKIEKIDKANVKRQVFYFDIAEVRHIWISHDGKPIVFPNPTIEDIKIHYYGKNLWLPPNYSDCIRTIKSSMFN